MTYKTIQDTVHGSVKLSGPFLELLETPEVQRLHGIAQLGLTKLVFPGANHTRLEHSIGAYHVAERMCESLGIEEEEKNIVKAAALLHDVGHAPFSHTLESILSRTTDSDHMDITKKIIRGEIYTEERDVPTIPEVLDDNDIPKDKVAELIKGRDNNSKITDFNVHQGQKYFGEERYLYQMIHGPMDVDQLDYLLRDSHYTGAAHGVIDLERVLQTIEIHNGNLVITKGGVPAVEGMLVARGLMFSSVYLHKTARIAELMLAKAIDGLDSEHEKIYRMTDWELMCFLKRKGGFQSEIIDRLKYRRLYKRCYSLEEDARGDNDEIELPGSISEIRDLEKTIAHNARVDENEVLIDVPNRELKLSEPRLAKTDIKILDDGRLFNLSKYSPLAYALQKRPSQPWVLMVSSPSELKGKVKRAAEKEIIG
ncbi:MAG: HD domain-containing protein [Thermoplasmatota archaeon]